MGQTLHKPLTEKDSACGRPSGALRLAWASSAMQGWRVGMEDAHVCIPDLADSPAARRSGSSTLCTRWRGVALFGVMDGHGGEQVAKYAERHLPEELLEVAVPSGAHRTAAPPSTADISAALTGAFHRVDELLADHSTSSAEVRSLANNPDGKAPSMRDRQLADIMGCTCNMVAITDQHIICANAGDSRAVLSRKGRAVPLSEDHKPNDPVERARIEKAKGWVETQNAGVNTQYRVNGNLNLSRALGDQQYKKDKSLPVEAQIISGTPDITVTERTAEDEFILICCDGIWDMKSNQAAVDFVHRLLPKAFDDAAGLQEAMERLMDDCCSPDLSTTHGLGGDNMTAVIVRLPPPGTAPKAAATAKKEAPTLLRARVQERGGNAGILNVKFDLQMECAEENVMFDLCHRTCEAEVTVHPGGVRKRFNLAEHLPRGARLLDSEAPVKFHKDSRTLRTKLRWEVNGA